MHARPAKSRCGALLATVAAVGGWRLLVLEGSRTGGTKNKVADLSPIHLRKQAATDGTYRSKYWFPGFGFDSRPNLQP